MDKSDHMKHFFTIVRNRMFIQSERSRVEADLLPAGRKAYLVSYAETIREAAATRCPSLAL